MECLLIFQLFIGILQTATYPLTPAQISISNIQMAKPQLTIGYLDTMTLYGPSLVYCDCLILLSFLLFFILHLAPRLQRDGRALLSRMVLPQAPSSPWARFTQATIHTPSPGGPHLLFPVLCKARPPEHFPICLFLSPAPQPRVPKSLEWLLLKKAHATPALWGFQPREEKGNCLLIFNSVVPPPSSGVLLECCLELCGSHMEVWGLGQKPSTNSMLQ